MNQLPSNSVHLRLTSDDDEDNYTLSVGDLFDLTLSYDADDDRWSLWCIRSERVEHDGRQLIYMTGDDRHGEPLPMCSLTDVLEDLKGKNDAA